jgi:hypothetical protein
MERDFMGLSSKESLPIAKQEINNEGFKDSGGMLTLHSTIFLHHHHSSTMLLLAI